MTQLDRTRTAEVARWIETQQPGAPVEIHVHHHHAPARTHSTWAQATPEARFAAIAAIALGVLTFLALFALAGQGSAATGLAVGIILGAAAVGTLLAVIMWKTVR